MEFNPIRSQYNNVNPSDYSENEDDLKLAEDLYSGQDMSKLVKTYLDENIPEEFKKGDLNKQFWSIMGNSIKLAFLNGEDQEDMEALFNISKYAYIMSKPTYEYTWNDDHALKQMRLHFIISAKRAIGSPNHRLNERTMLATQINQQIRSNTETMRSSSSGGFLSSLKRFF